MTYCELESRLQALDAALEDLPPDAVEAFRAFTAEVVRTLLDLGNQVDHYRMQSECQVPWFKRLWERSVY